MEAREWAGSLGLIDWGLESGAGSLGLIDWGLGSGADIMGAGEWGWRWNWNDVTLATEV